MDSSSERYSCYQQLSKSGLRAAKYPGKIVIGGPSVSFTPAGQLVKLFPGADYFVRGYGEEALLALALGATSGKGTLNASRPDLGAVCSFAPEKTVSPWSEPHHMVGPKGNAWWETKRGCPFRCAFCQHSGAGVANGVRQFPLPRLLHEMEAIVRAAVSDLKVTDPVFNMPNSQYLEVMRTLLDLGFSGRIAMEARFEFVTEDFVRLCAMLGAVPEFGLQTTVLPEEEAIGRRNDPEKVRRAADLLHKHNVPFMVSLLYGLPLQTPTSFAESLRFARSLEPKTIESYRLGLYRGTKLEAERGRWGFQVSEGGLPLVLATGVASRAEVNEMEAMGKTAMS